MKILNKMKSLALLLVSISFAVFTLVFTTPAYAATSPSLGTADSFAVLAGTAIPLVPSAAITGDVGLSPAAGSNYTGITAAQVTGTIYAVDASGPAGSVSNPGLLTTAKNDLITAYDGLAATDNATCTTDWSGTGPIDLTTKSPLTPGIYCADAFILTGNLTLSGSDVYIFRSASTIITSPGSFVTGDNACNVWWRAESSATPDTTTSFIGNILALTNISLKTGATLNGRALARNAAVTMDANTISVAICAAAPIAAPTPTVGAPTPTPEGDHLSDNRSDNRSSPPPQPAGNVLGVTTETLAVTGSNEQSVRIILAATAALSVFLLGKALLRRNETS
jgi:hypothetical protein